MTTESMYQEIGIRPEVLKFGTKIEKSLKERFDRIDETAEYNQLKVIHAMQKNRVCAECFNQSSGYGYNDLGRETLEAVYASVFHTGGCALVRPQITCGTHALALALMPAIYGREMSFCPFPASPTTRWRRSSASGLPWAP